MRPQRPPAHYEPYLDGLFTYCLSVLCDHEAATSALGEVLAVAERQRQRGRGRRVQADGEQRRAWLYALARWACLRVLAERREEERSAGAGRAGEGVTERVGGADGVEREAATEAECESATECESASGGVRGEGDDPEAGGSVGDVVDAEGGEGGEGVVGVAGGEGAERAEDPGGKAADLGEGPGGEGSDGEGAVERTEDAEGDGRVERAEGPGGEGSDDEEAAPRGEGVVGDGWADRGEGGEGAGRATEGSEDAVDRHRRELAALAWPEAAGTSSEQREALELAVRHQLAPREVAAVLGRERDETRALLASAACEVERTRAALAVVELGRCPAVSRLTADNQVLLSATLRHELVRHVDDCRECRRRAEHATADGPWPGTAATADPLPVVEAPRSGVHAAMLCALRVRPARAGAGPRFDRCGFPVEPKDRAARRRRLRGQVMAVTVVATVVVAPVLALWAAYRGAPHAGGVADLDTLSAPPEGTVIEDRPFREAGGARADPTRSAPESRGPRHSVEVLGGAAGDRATGEPGRRRKDTLPRWPLASVPPLPTVSPVSPTLEGAPGGAGGAGGMGAPAAAGTGTGGAGADRMGSAGTESGPPGRPGPRRSVAGPGRLTLAAEPRDGFTVITLSASGGSPVRWTAAASASWLQLSRTAGLLRPGESTSVTVAVDHDREPAGEWSARVEVAPGGMVVIDGRGADPEPAPTAPGPVPAPFPTLPAAPTAPPAMPQP
ncbi:hypothetical protein ACZ90_27490 [Streptomyces albus subsp. albus]|nr:hypothetical protein ACZ90_27490 [Streptomyces albus subsp. albus]